MQEQTRTPVFQNSDGTWGHLTKTINPLICTIEYGSSTRFSSKEEAEKSYQKSMDSYQDLLSMLKKTRNVPFTFSEYLDYWIKEIQALRRITIARSNEKNVKDRRIIFSDHCAYRSNIIDLVFSKPAVVDDYIKFRQAVRLKQSILLC